MTDPLVIAAAIGAVPATVAAIAAFKVNKKVSTNGSKKNIGMLVEFNHDMLMQHLNDPNAHTKGICRSCATLD